MSRILAIIAFFMLVNDLMLDGQQNSTLFFMPSTPQTNFVNPAIRNECKWMLGLPFISSFHLEYGNSVFSVMNVLKKQPDQTYSFDGNEVLSKLGRTNYLSAELHTNLFFLSFWRRNNFFTISVNEKVDLFLTFPADLFAIGWKGNTQFEGQHADLSRTGLFLNYRREYAFGIAKQPSSDLVLGMRIKLLFGKLNTSFPKSQMDLYTSPDSLDLNFNNNWHVNVSLPINIEVNPDNTIENVTFTGNLGQVLLNRSNVGFAFDLGFIKYQDEEVTVSGSILDIGVIRWSDGYSTSQNGQYTYHGLIGDTMNANSYIKDLISVLKNNFGITAVSKSYLSFLIPTYYIGATYSLKEDLSTGALLSGKICRYRVTSGLTLSLNKKFSQSASVSLSWSYLYKSFKNIGLGFKIGSSPVQFYAVSDNVMGLIKPLDTKNINLRFGLQLNFGCSKVENISNCGCSWLRKAEDTRIREQRMRNKLRKF